MAEIKLNVTCKELDGAVSSSQVTFNEENEVTAENSKEGPVVHVGEIESQGIASGMVPVANGQGGTAWGAKADLVDGKVPPTQLPEVADGTYVQGSALHIGEIKGPTSVITIDGVPYFHKQEFDLEALLSGSYYDILTGETSSSFVGYPNLFKIPQVNQTMLSIAQGTSINLASYTSRAFTVVDTQEEVTDNTKICLPTCSAYYGKLNGSTFISYYNLKGEGLPTEVNEVTDGEHTIPVRDSRVPSTSSADEGKVLGVNASGDIVPQTPASGGVTSIGGATGSITLGSGLTMSGNQLSASGGGGTQIKKATITVGDVFTGYVIEIIFTGTFGTSSMNILSVTYADSSFDVKNIYDFYLGSTMNDFYYKKSSNEQSYATLTLDSAWIIVNL